MAFEMEYKDDIQARMVKELGKVSDKATLEGSFSRDLISANSVEFENAKAEMALLIQAAYGTTAWGKYLTAIASEFGVDRKQATHAVGTIRIYGTAGSYIPIGSLFDTQDGAVQVKTNAGATVGKDGCIDVAVTSVNTGSSQNIAAHTLTHIPMSLPGIERVDNPEATHDGREEESDEELRKRYLAYVREPATSGNIYHYKHWAMACDGVGDVKVLPLALGAGTVKVLIIDPDQNSCSKETIQRVKDYIESVRPIGASVTVTTPAYTIINVSAKIVSVHGNAAECQKAIQDALQSYFVAEGFQASSVSIAQVGRVMLNTGLISDYSELKLNGQSGNISLSVDQLPRLGKLELTQ